MGSGNSKLGGGTHVVVVGGNFAGIAAARALMKAGARVTVIEPNDRLFVNFGAYKGAVDPVFANQLFIPYDREFANYPESKMVRGWASAVNDKTRTVTFTPVDATGASSTTSATVSYDYLILATGQEYGPPMKSETSIAATKALLSRVSDEIAKAPTVLIVGGGPSGIELAGQVKAYHPSKPVTLVHSSALLLSEKSANWPKRFQEYIAKECIAAGITLHLGSRVDLEAVGKGEGVTTVTPGVFSGSQTVKTSTGELKSDLVILANGSKPATGWLKGSSLAGALDVAGFVKVELTFQVKDSPRVFAIGDCAATKDSKTFVAAAFHHVPVVVENIKRLAPAVAAAGGDAERASVKLKQRGTPFNALGLIPIGTKYGGANLPFGIFKFLLPLKNKDFFSEKTATDMGYKVEEVRAANA